MEILGKVLGSPARVKIMRLFLLNPSRVFANKDIVKRSRVSADIVRRETKLLASIGFIRKRTKNWSFDYSFRYANEIEALFVNSDTLDSEEIANNFKRAGRVKLLIISGVFIKNKDTRLDLLIAGDKLKRGKIDEEVRKLEAELGVELRYAVFDTKEFVYRMSMYDKLIRDVLDFPYKVVLQSKELSTLTSKKS